MPDNFVRLRKGERLPVYGQESVVSGTLTISSSPTPTVTLYNASGAVVGGFNGIAATGFDAGALASPRVWHLLDTAGLAPGFYMAVFGFTATGSDGITRLFAPSVEVQVLETVA